MDNQMNHVLVIAAHPDDEVLGCGGTIARLVRDGVRCDCLILGEGLSARNGNRDIDDELRLALSVGRKKAEEILGFQENIWLDLPDNQFDTVPLLDIIRKVEKTIHELTPDTIFTHSATDVNKDHNLVHEAVITATRPTMDCPVRSLYAFEIPSSTEWGFGHGGVFNPDVFFNIEDTIDVKVQAMDAYVSEVRKFPHPRSATLLRALSQVRGSAAGFHHAEAYETIRVLR